MFERNRRLVIFGVGVALSALLISGCGSVSTSSSPTQVNWQMCQLLASEVSEPEPELSEQFGWWDTADDTARKFEVAKEPLPPWGEPSEGGITTRDRRAPFSEWDQDHEAVRRWDQQGEEVTFRRSAPESAPQLPSEGHLMTLTAYAGEPLIDFRSLADRDDVLGEFGLADVVPTVMSSRFGEFERFESLPLDGPAGRNAISTLARHSRVPFAIDLWTDDDGSVERVRFMSQKLDVSYVELRLDTSDDVEPGEVGLLGCPNTFELAHDGDWVGFETWESDVVVPLKISLDDDGVPYEIWEWEEWGSFGGFEGLGTLTAPSGELLVLNGSIASCCLASVNDPREHQRVDFDSPGGEIEVTRIVEELTGRTATLGLRFDVPGSLVERWENLEFAYGTDGGQGAVMSADAAEWVELNPPDSELMDDPEWPESDVLIRDVDPVPGNDVLVFGNGYGDGGFPMTKGFDADGNLVSLIVFDAARLPWSLFVPDGTPPLDVTESIDALTECLNGEREVLADGTCNFEP